MRAVLADTSETVLATRASNGLDKLDERWEGEWHLVNPPKFWHSRVSTQLLLVLGPVAQRQGLIPCGDATGVFGTDTDWRIPDQAYAKPEHAGEDGLTSAVLVVEIRSPGDETYAKLPFYAARGIDEVLVVHRDRTFEFYRLRSDATYVQIEAEDGSARSNALAVRFETVDGPKLRLSWDDGSADI